MTDWTTPKQLKILKTKEKLVKRGQGEKFLPTAKRVPSLTTLRNIYAHRKKDFVERYHDMEKRKLQTRASSSRFQDMYPALVIDLFNWSRMRFIKAHDNAVAGKAISPEILDRESPDLGMIQDSVK